MCLDEVASISCTPYFSLFLFSLFPYFYFPNVLYTIESTAKGSHSDRRMYHCSIFEHANISNRQLRVGESHTERNGSYLIRPGKS